MVDPNGENVVETFVTHLQIKKEELDLLPSGFEKEVKIDLSDIHINRAQQIPLSFYRYLYREVGTIWFWDERTNYSDEKLDSIINDNDVWICVVYIKGSPAGFFELDWREFDVKGVEIVYFGLLPECIGYGLGCYLLRFIVDMVWKHNPETRRLWVHTCNFDHPAALRTYQRAGFKIFGLEKKFEEDSEIYRSEEIQAKLKRVLAYKKLEETHLGK